MKDLTEAQFQQRLRQIRYARKIFGHITEQNVTIAYRIYREIFEEKDLPEMITYKQGGKRQLVRISDCKRPRCPECRARLSLRHVCTPKGPANIHGYESCWECLGEKCCYEKYSTNRVDQEVRELKKKEAF